MGIFPDTPGQLILQYMVGSGRIHGCPYTCNNEEDPIKHEGARVATTLYINFSDAKGQLPT